MADRPLTDLRKARRRATLKEGSALTSASVSASVVAAYLAVASAGTAAGPLAPRRRLGCGAPCTACAPG
jgi:hypothetical protein